MLLMYFFSLLPIPVLAVTAIVMYRRKQHKLYPVFWAYVIFQFSRCTVEAIAYGVSYAAFFYSYWSSSALSVILQRPSVRWTEDPGDPALYCAECTDKAGGRNRIHVVPVRFIVICEKGHLDEFPWEWWVKHKEDCSRRYDLKLEGSATERGWPDSYFLA